MKPIGLLTPIQEFFRQNIIRLIIYSGSVFALIWSINEMVEMWGQANALAQHIDDTMMNFYIENRNRRIL